MQYRYKHYHITTTYEAEKARDGFMAYQHNRVTVMNTRTKAKASFDFWGSQVQPEIRSPGDCCNALECWLSDGIAFHNANDVDDFASEFGYTGIPQAIKAYRGCEKAWGQIQRVIDDDPYDLANALRD